MLTRLEIKNFRGIKELSLTDTSRVNLIVGRNDTGKTTLLEAIRLLLSGDPRFLRRVARNRMDRKPLDLSLDYQSAFHQADSDETLSVSGTVAAINLLAQAKIQDIQGEETLPFDLESDSDTFGEVESLLQPRREIIVEMTANSHAKAIIRQPLHSPRIPTAGSQRRFLGEVFPEVPPFIWLGTNRVEGWSRVHHYSNLYRNGGKDILLNILRDIEPRLRSLVVLTVKRSEPFGSTAVLEVDLGFAQTLPLESMGDGFSNLISILSAIGGSRDGLCLIDEVENGIHYSLLTQLWQSISSASTAYNSQVWATTHSQDCIDAIHEAFKDTPDDLRIHRLERRDDGTVRIHTFDHAMIGRALERGLEVR